MSLSQNCICKRSNFCPTGKIKRSTSKKNFKKNGYLILESSKALWNYLKHLLHVWSWILTHSPGCIWMLPMGTYSSCRFCQMCHTPGEDRKDPELLLHLQRHKNVFLVLKFLLCVFNFGNKRTMFTCDRIIYLHCVISDCGDDCSHKY